MKPLYIKKNGTVHKVAGVGMPSVYPASNVSYDNTTSGLTADDSQSAIDELADSVADKADKDGSYSTLTAGQILVNNNLLTTDETPFLTRQTLNPTGFSGYVREKLIGASYAWNQLVENGNFASTSGWTAQRGTISASNNVLSYTLTEVGVADVQNRIERYVNVIQGHKYLLSASFKPAHTTKVGFRNAQSNFTLGETTVSSTTFTRVSAIFNATATASLNMYFVWVCGDAGYSVGDVNQIKECQVIDLTLAFGSTIADYLYSLANNGGITKLRDMGCPIDKYTAYGNYLVSSKTSGKLIRGFNQWDEKFSKNDYYILNTGAELNNAQWDITSYIPVIPNITYYFKDLSQATSACIAWYDGNKNFISTTSIASQGFTDTAPSNARYLRCSVRKTMSNTCINISDTNKNGQYEPYSSTTYSLGNDELRGLFKLVNNEIIADGDVKESNGVLTRMFGETAFSALNWGYSSSSKRYEAPLPSNAKNVGTGRFADFVCSNYTPDTSAAVGDSGKCFISSTNIYVYDPNQSGTPTGLCNYPLAIPTTEQSTPFADPMSLVGATTEEYIDTRDIPCPVGHETGYYGIGTEGFSMPPAPKNMDNIYKLYYSKNGYGFIPDDFKSKTFSYKYTGATVADTQYNVQNAKVNVFGLESKDTIIGMSIYMSMGDTACNFSTPVYNKNSDMFIFKPSDSNASYLTFDGVVFYR